MSDNLNSDNTNYSSPTSGYMNQDDSFLKLMIEVEADLEKFENETLRRRRLQVDLQKKKKEWVSMALGVEPVCNELGIAEIIGQLRSRATVIGRMTWKTEQQIASDMFQFHRTLIELFSLRADDWNLDEEMIKPLIESCLGLVQDIIYSSKNGFTAINVKSQYTRHENASSSTDGDKSRTVMGVRIN